MHYLEYEHRPKVPEVADWLNSQLVDFIKVMNDWFQCVDEVETGVKLDIVENR